MLDWQSQRICCKYIKTVQDATRQKLWAQVVFVFFFTNPWHTWEVEVRFTNQWYQYKKRRAHTHTHLKKELNSVFINDGVVSLHHVDVSRHFCAVLYMVIVLILSHIHCLIGLAVKASTSRAEDPGIFPGSSHTSDLKIGTPVATLPDAWCYIIESVSGLVSPVSVYCYWVR